VKFCSLLVVLSSTKETKKEENFSQEKSLFCSLTHFTRKRKGRKNSSHYEGRSAFSESALKKVFFFSRGRFVLSRVKRFFLFLLLFFYIANSSIL
jgi:hypothetical protein